MVALRRTRGGGPRAGGPAADPVERHEDAVEHQRERQRGEREVDAAEAQRRDRQQRADDRGEHRRRRASSAAPGRSHALTSCAVANPPTAANVAWHSEIWPGHARDHRDRQEDRRRRRPPWSRCRSQKSFSENSREHDDRATTNATPSACVAMRQAAAALGRRRGPAAAGRRPTSGSVISRLLAQPGPEQQQEEEQHERQRRSQTRWRGCCSAGGSRRGCPGGCRAAGHRASAIGMLVSRPNAAAAIAATSRIVKLVGGELREQRCEQHSGEPGEQARQHPRERAHAVGVDARERGHARALDHRPHPQTDGRVPEQQRQRRRPRRRWR